MKVSSALEVKQNAQYNPEGSDLRRAQLRMVEMLVWVDHVMKKYNIPYCMDSGTLLGAVRHKGFIPWDDDIDLIYPAKYTKQLKEAFYKESHPNYIIQDDKTDPYCFKFWPVIRDRNSQYCHQNPHVVKLEELKRFRGVQIDLFPIDNHTYRLINHALFYPNVLGRFVGLFGNGLCSKNVAWIMFNLQKMVAYLLSILTPKQKIWTKSYGAGFVSRYYEEDLFPATPLEFEGHYFPAPKNYNRVLAMMYGEYMQMPPVDEMNHHHICEIRIW